MYGPDEHMIDPRNPSNWKDPELRYEIRAHGKFIGDYNNEDSARAGILNCEDYFGTELSLHEIDIEYGDVTCIMSAEWDEDINRYVEN